MHLVHDNHDVERSPPGQRQDHLLQPLRHDGLFDDLRCLARCGELTEQAAALRYRVALLDVDLTGDADALRLVDAYRRWLGP